MRSYRCIPIFISYEAEREASREKGPSPTSAQRMLLGLLELLWSCWDSGSLTPGPQGAEGPQVCACKELPGDHGLMCIAH